MAEEAGEGNTKLSQTRGEFQDRRAERKDGHVIRDLYDWKNTDECFVCQDDEKVHPARLRS